MFTVYKKCVGIDIDMCWEEDIDYFDTRSEAVAFAKMLNETYSDPSWKGHKHYLGKFYDAEISKATIDHKCYQNALLKANSI